MWLKEWASAADTYSMSREYLFAPYVPLQTVEFPKELVDMAGGPEAFMKMVDDIRNPPLGPHWPNRPPEEGVAQPEANP